MQSISFAHRIAGLKPSAIREILKVTQNPDVISFAAGNPSPSVFPKEEISAITMDIVKHQASTVFQYGTTEGYLPLIEQTLNWVRKKYGIDAKTNEMLITSGGQQVIDLVAKILLNEGDAVVCENPSFIGALNAFRSYGVELIPCALDEEGMDTNQLEMILQHHTNIKLIYTIPTFQNPTGITMSLKRRKELLALAQKYHVLILEDNPYYDLRYFGEHLPTLKSLDTENLVIYAGSYSKILAPGIRVGYAIADSVILSKMIVAKQTEDVHTNLLSQMMVAQFLEQYSLEAHIQNICNVYRKKLALMRHCLEQQKEKRLHVNIPQGGLFFWCTLSSGQDSVAFARRLAARQVAIVPGVTFLTDEAHKSSAFRLNFSLPSEEQIQKGIAILLDEI